MEEILIPSFLFFDIEQELFALEDFRSAMERQLPAVAENERNRFYEELAEEEDEAVRHGMTTWAETFYEDGLPRLFRSQILVTLWAIYESGISEIALHLRQKGGYKLKPSDFHGDKLAKHKLYFEHILKFPLITDAAVEKYLDILLKLRNAIAHANGRREAVKPPEDWRIFAALEDEGKGISTDLDRLNFSSDFIEEMVAVISKSLNDLIERAKLF